MLHHQNSKISIKDLDRIVKHFILHELILVLRDVFGVDECFSLLDQLSVGLFLGFHLGLLKI